MTDGLNHSISGVDNLVDRLSKFPSKLQKRVVTSAARKGAMVIRDAARQNAKAIDNPNTPTSISKNIAVQSASRLGRQNGGVAMRIGVLGGARSYSDTRANRRKGQAGATYKTDGDKGNPGGDTFYWRYLEFGAPGAGVAPVPLLRAGAASSQNKAIDKITEEINKGLDKLEQLD